MVDFHSGSPFAQKSQRMSHMISRFAAESKHRRCHQAFVPFLLPLTTPTNSQDAGCVAARTRVRRGRYGCGELSAFVPLSVRVFLSCA